MTVFDPRAVTERLGWRYATKKFDATKKIPADVWSALEKSLVMAPSSYGLQPWKFVVVTDAAVRAKLKPASWEQTQITDASHLVVLCRKLEVTTADVDAYVKDICATRGASPESLAQYRGMMVGSVTNPAGLPGGSMEIWTRSQVYIALGFFLSAAAMMGVDACPMEGFNPAVYDEVLGLKGTGYTAVVLATAGYRAPDDALSGMKKVRFDGARVVAKA